MEESTYILNSKTQNYFLYTPQTGEVRSLSNTALYLHQKERNLSKFLFPLSFSHTSKHEFCVLHCFEGKEIQNMYLILCKYGTVNTYVQLLRFLVLAPEEKMSLQEQNVKPLL